MKKKALIITLTTEQAEAIAELPQFVRNPGVAIPFNQRGVAGIERIAERTIS